MKLEIGNTVSFGYNGKTRVVRIEKVKKSAGNMFIGPCPILITGYDYASNGYRSFSVDKITGTITNNAIDNVIENC